MSIRQPSSPARPRPPGRVRSLGERLREQRPQLILTAIATGFLLLVVVALIAYASRGVEGSSPPATAGSTDAGPIRLPLDLEAVGFADGTVLDVAPDEGPDAISFCNHAPAASGLVDWAGNRLTERDGRRRVAQLVARFATSVDAAAYLSENSTIVDCESWDAETDADTVRFTVSETRPETLHGDETKQFDLEANTVGPDLFLRIVLVRSGPEVAQFTLVSANQQDLSLLDDLVTEATAELGY